VADALLERYGELIEAGLTEIESRAAELSATALADALLDLIAGLCKETSAASAQLDAHSDWSDRRAELRRMSHRLIARILKVRQPVLSSELVESMAVVLLQNIRAMAALIAAQDGEKDKGARCWAHRSAGQCFWRNSTAVGHAADHISGMPSPYRHPGFCHERLQSRIPNSSNLFTIPKNKSQ
jgi:hypothetical protein